MEHQTGFQVPPIQWETPEPNLNNPSQSNSNSLESDPLPSLGNEFIAKIPEQDQAIVARYVKDWDAGVTKKFQEIHNQYAPYKDLGPIEQIQSAMQVNSALMSDPIAFLNQLRDTIEELRAEGYLDVEIEEGLGVDLGTGQNPEGQQPAVDPRDAKIAQLEQMLAGIDGKFNQFTQQQQEAQQMQELDNLMVALHNEHGAFDDEFFLVQLQNGYTPEQAIEKWNKLAEGAVNSQPRRNPPPLLGGAGNIPSGQVDPSKLSSNDRIKFITGQLEAARGN